MENFPYTDLIVLALIAGFILLRLRNTLGKDVGIDPREIIKKQQEQLKETVIKITGREPRPDAGAAKEVAHPEPVAPAAQSGIQALKVADPAFSVPNFLNGAKTAYEWVIGAYNKGEKPMLSRLLSEPVAQMFIGEIDRRPTTGRIPETTIVSIGAVEIVEAELKFSVARIGVKFTSEQIHLVRDAQGKVLEGNPSAIQNVEDVWVFERNLASGSPDWLVVNT